METNKKNRRGMLLGLAVAGLAAVAILVWLLLAEWIPGGHYQQGQQAMLEKRYVEANAAFTEAGTYRDATLRAKEAMYLCGMEQAAEMDYAAAVAAFAQAGDYQDAAALSQEYQTRLYVSSAAENFSSEGDTVTIFDEQGQKLAQVSLDGTVSVAENVGKDDSEAVEANNSNNMWLEFDLQGNGDLTPKQQGDLWGYVDQTGAFVIEPAYEQAYAMMDGIALVRVPTRHELVNGVYQEVAGLWQVIDETGKTLLAAHDWEPYVAKSFRGGWLPVEFASGGLGYINAQGKKFLDRTWESIDASYSRYAIAADYFPSTTYVLDMETESIVSSIKTSEDVTVDTNGFVFERHRQSSNYTLRNFSGTALLSGIEPETTYTSSLGVPFYVLGSDYLVVGNSKDGYGLYSISGALEHRQIRCIVASQWDFLCGDLAPRLMTSPSATGGIFSIGKKQYVAEFGGSTMVYGFVNVDGTLVSDVQWWDIHDFNADGIAFVRDKRGWGVIDTTGAFVIEPQWQRVASDGFCNGLCAVKDENAWGYIDQTGQLVIDCQFTEAGSFLEGETAIVAKDNEKLLIDKQGQVIIAGFEQIRKLNNGMLAVMRDGTWQLLNQAGERIF